MSKKPGKSGGDDVAADFEDHCWKDVMPAHVLELYKHYARKTFVGPSPALLAIDLYKLVYQGGPKPVEVVSKQYPSSCGIFAYNAIPHTQRVFGAARAAGIPVIYTTSETRPDSRPGRVTATNRRSVPLDPEIYEIKEEFAPQPGDLVITKQRASAFYGTPLAAHLNMLGVRSLIVVGDSTSGCVRASSVDGYSAGYHVTLVEEGCFDRCELSHKVNLFDMHHKYCDVMHVDEVVAALGKIKGVKVAAE